MPNNIPMVRLFSSLAFIVLLVWVLRVSEPLVLPLVCAFILFYLLVGLTEWMKKFKIPAPVGLGVSLFVVGFLMVWGFNTVADSIYGLVQDAPAYQARINEFVIHLNHYLDHIAQGHLHFDLASYTHDLNFAQVIQVLAGTLATLAKYFGMIAIYLLFLLLEYPSFNRKMRSLCGTDRRYNQVRRMVGAIRKDINIYLEVKSFSNILMSILVYGVLWWAGAKYASFWAAMAFILNFIPTLGAIAVVLMVIPAVASQGLPMADIALVTAIIASGHALAGSVLEPKLMGHSLGISPLVILLSLAFWGSVWGIVGMFLSVPLMVMLIIFFSQVPQTRWLAILMSAEGTIKPTLDE